MLKPIFFLSSLLTIETSSFDHGTSVKLARIYNGTNIKIEDVPFFVQLYWMRLDSSLPTVGSVCGGAIVDKNWILTAAHCLLQRTKKNLLVVSGSDERAVGEWHKVSYLTRHENFNLDTFEHDIGLIKLLTPLKFNDKQKPIKIRSKPLTNGELLRPCGMGAMNKNEDLSPVLQSTLQPYMDPKSCQVRFDTVEDTWPNIAQGMFCLGWENKTHAWHGDSGGPIVDLEGRLVGVVSWGDDQWPLRVPKVNTNVMNYRAWIEEKTNILGLQSGAFYTLG